MRILIIVIYILTLTKSKKHCWKETRLLKYFKVKSCHRSTLPVLFWGNSNQVAHCEALARQKNGLAYNFSPLAARKYNSGFTFTCQVLGCPEITGSSTLIEDVGFDYYSAYGNFRFTENATCIKSIGLFSIFHQKDNYTRSIDACQKMGADIADVNSEIRTKYLSKLVNDTVDSWYKVAYVGLDDIEQEGTFVNSVNMPLNCFYFRAWAPGHPIFDNENHDCVVLDDKKFWRVVNCRRKFSVICEFFPEKPPRTTIGLCNNILNKIKKRRCIANHKKIKETIRNLTRIDQCAVWNTEV